MDKHCPVWASCREWTPSGAIGEELAFGKFHASAGLLAFALPCRCACQDTSARKLTSGACRVMWSVPGFGDSGSIPLRGCHPRIAVALQQWPLPSLLQARQCEGTQSGRRSLGSMCRTLKVISGLYLTNVLQRCPVYTPVRWYSVEEWRENLFLQHRPRRRTLSCRMSTPGL
jgi:hypothetical protein